MSANSGNSPFLSSRLGPIDVAAFRNRDDHGNPRGISACIRRSHYDDASKEWKSSRCYLAPSEIAAAIALLTKLQEQLLLLETGSPQTNEAPEESVPF